MTLLTKVVEKGMVTLQKTSQEGEDLLDYVNIRDINGGLLRSVGFFGALLDFFSSTQCGVWILHAWASARETGKLSSFVQGML